MKKAIGMMLALSIGSAFAADPVIEQINVTQDAVKVALEELDQGKVNTQPGTDFEIKNKAFSEAASKALLKFEEAVRVRVLQSLSSVIGQYNKTYNNRALGPARQEILRNLKDQIEKIQVDKSFVYREAYLELYSVFPDVPVAYDRELPSEYSYRGRLFTKYDFVKRNPLCIREFANCRGKYDFEYVGSLYWSRSGTKEFNKTRLLGWEEEAKKDLRALLIETEVFSPEKMRTVLLQGCYTSTCYFLTQAQFTIWKTMVEASLARDILIKLEDGHEIKITKNVSRRGSIEDAFGPMLNNVSTEGLVNNLPSESSSERVKILSEVNAELEKDFCRKARKIAENLCSTTREGCISAAEVSLLKDRHGSNASCLK